MVRRTLRARSPAIGGAARRGRQSRAPDQQEDYEVPQVYREMLAEADARESHRSENDRPIKRRKTGELKAIPVQPKPEDQTTVLPPSDTSANIDKQLQTAYDSTATDESDMEWEEVEIQRAPSDGFQTAPGPKASGDESLQITLGQRDNGRKRPVPKRRPISTAEKKLRLDIHKVHILCLLGHVQQRNLLCNDEEVHAILKPMLPKHIISLLNPAEDKLQLTRSTTFVEGLNKACEVFIRRFRVTKPGLKRAHWANSPDSLKKTLESIMSDAEVILSKDDFRRQAKTLQGSRDFGAQLFCALLRSAGVEARLVFSLQALPFSGTVKDTVPLKPESQFIVISSDDRESSTDERSRSHNSVTPSRIRRLGQPQFTTPRPFQTSKYSGARPLLHESSYPVFWVEAFNEAVQKWIPVDPLVTKSLAKPFKYEPPASDPNNNMSYVVAFEEDASARDVTRRYAKAFNSKTRKTRVESTRNGERWWTRTLEFYERPFLEDRDEMEISELTAKSAAEPMPRNVQDFKDHPIYALERHLRQNEVIFPKRVIGQVGASKSGSKNQALELVYRRSDVHALRSANGWYRLGRDIKMGEQPLKHVRANRNRAPEINNDEEIDYDDLETPLYAYFQTDLYKPPPVVQGRIPKNVYGNLDIYVPSMVPPGASHIKHRDAVQAARILGIDYAEAVTGFEFKGRHGTAVSDGMVIANDFREAAEEVIRGLEDERLQAELEAKSAEALRVWKHFLLRLRIAERIKGYAVEGVNDEGTEDEASIGVYDGDREESEENAGGFFRESGQGVANASSDFESRHSAEKNHTDGQSPSYAASGADESLGGGFFPEEPAQDAAEPVPQSSIAGSTGTATATSRQLTASQPHYVLIVSSDKRKASTNSEPYSNVGRSSHENASTLSNLKTEDPERTTTAKLTGSSEAPIPIDSSTGGDSKSASVEVLSRAPSPEADGRRRSNSIADAVSLLSHDPEDEDAIPDWLMSD